MIIYGFQNIRALLDHQAKIFSLHVMIKENSDRNAEILGLAKKLKVEVYQYDSRSKSSFEREFKKAGGADAELSSSQNVFANVPEPKIWDMDELLATIEMNQSPPPLVLLLDELTDPQNLGSIWRSAAAYGVSGIFLTEHRSSAITPAALRISSGGFLFVPLARITNLSQAMERLKEKGFWILGTSEHAKEDINATHLNSPLAVVIGNEERGLRQLTEKNCDWLVKLPCSGSIISLNAAVATAATLSLARYVQAQNK